MPLAQRHSRSATIARLAEWLGRVDRPRLAISTILTLAGLTGFLASAFMLSLGMVSMPLRYGTALLLGYGSFLIGVRFWLYRQLRRPPSSEHQWLDALDPALLDPGDSPPSSVPFEFGGGGSSSGGGGGVTIELVGEAAPEDASASAEAVAGAVELEEGTLLLLPVLLAVAVLAGFVGTALLVTGAPVLLGEVLLDGLIAGAAYRRLQHLRPQHWVHGAIRRTWRSALAFLAALVGGGWLIQWLVPSARSIGDVLAR